MVAMDLKDFTIVNGELHHRGSGGAIARAIFVTKAKEELERVHELSCGDNDSGFIGAFKGKDTTGLKWPKRLPNYNLLAIMLGTPRCKGIIVSLISRRLETTLSRFSSTWCIPM